MARSNSLPYELPMSFITKLTCYLLLLALIICGVEATEIQCKSEMIDVDVVIKESPETGRLYLLFFILNDVVVKNLDKSELVIQEQHVHYNNESISLEIDLNSGDGLLKIENESLTISSCQSTDSLKHDTY